MIICCSHNTDGACAKYAQQIANGQEIIHLVEEDANNVLTGLSSPICVISPVYCNNHSSHLQQLLEEMNEQPADFLEGTMWELHTIGENSYGDELHRPFIKTIEYYGGTIIGTKHHLREDILA